GQLVPLRPVRGRRPVGAALGRAELRAGLGPVRRVGGGDAAADRQGRRGLRPVPRGVLEAVRPAPLGAGLGPADRRARPRRLGGPRALSRPQWATWRARAASISAQAAAVPSKPRVLECLSGSSIL